MVEDKEIKRRLARLEEWMCMRELASATKTIYLRCARVFMMRVQKPLRSVRRRDVEVFLLGLVTQKRSAVTRNVNLAAIRCLFRATASHDPSEDLPQARVARRVPRFHQALAEQRRQGQHGR